LPYALICGKIEKPKILSKSLDKYAYHNIMPSQILDSEHIFCSPAFVIRYSEEQVNFNIIVQFRTEIDMSPNMKNTDFYMETELFCADFNGANNAENAISNYFALVFLNFRPLKIGRISNEKCTEKNA